MSVLTTTCSRCHAPVTLHVPDVLLTLVEDDDEPGQLAHVCPVCNDLTFRAISLEALLKLLESGATVMAPSLHLTHPENPPHGPALNIDDLIDFHVALMSDHWAACADLS